MKLRQWWTSNRELLKYKVHVALGALALRAPVGRALAHDGVADRGGADSAGLALALVDEELLAEVAGLAVGVEEISQGGAALGDGFFQDRPDRGDQLGEARL